MSLVGSRPQAAACTLWARPISPPSTVTALLRAMFWGLKGATAKPVRLSQRHSPVTRALLPASDVQPWTMRDFMWGKRTWVKGARLECR
jgi:hypothetical protein